MSNSIIVAIDEFENVRFDEILSQLNPKKCMIKIGSVTFNAIGRDSVMKAAELGFDIFLDLKLHDIPNTVKKSIEGLISLPIKMMTVHISGGKKMLEQSISISNKTDIKIFGVTVLTSLTNSDTELIYKSSIEDQVIEMIKLAEESKIDGIVCSPHELSLVKAHSSLLTITPGIRLPESKIDDQARAMSPKQAIKNGSDYIVIGRPITASKNISKSLDEIYDSIK